MSKITLNIKDIEPLFPEAKLIPNLPRKKKKKLKIKITKELVLLSLGYAIEIIGEFEKKTNKK